MKRMRRLLMLLVMLLTVCPAGLAVEPDPIPVLAVEEIPKSPAGMTHYLLVCADSWDADVKNLGYTDGIVLVTLDTAARRVMLTSFIRDMLIQRPDGKFGRLNYVARTFSMDDLVTTLNTHFGLDIAKYVLVDMGQVQKIIDAVGGVDITVTDNEASYLRRYAISSTSTKPSMKNAGTYHFSGHAAVIYMRIRKVAVNGVSGDFMRTQRVRTVLSTIADSLAGITYDQAMDLLDVIVANTCATNMTTGDMLAAVDQALDLAGTPVEQIRMPIDDTSHPFAYAGMATQQIDFLANRDALEDFLYDTYVVVDE